RVPVHQFADGQPPGLAVEDDEDLLVPRQRFTDPFTLQFGPGYDSNRGTDLGGHRLGEQRLAGAGRAPEDHAPGDQLLDAADLLPVVHRVFAGKQVPHLVAQLLLALDVAADVAVEADVRYLQRAAQRRLPQLAVGALWVGRVVLALQRAQQLAQPHGVDAG